MIDLFTNRETTGRYRMGELESYTKQLEKENEQLRRAIKA